MITMCSKEDIYEVARQLIDNLDNDIKEIVSGLEWIMKNENITLEEMNKQCWEDSTEVFNKIYG